MTNIKDNIEQKFSNKMINDTEKYSQIYNFNTKEKDKDFSTHNNEADAFKHTYMQAWLTVMGNQMLAKILGDMHENDGNTRNQPSAEENMDLWNNSQGRQIGLEIKKQLYTISGKKYSNTEIEDLIAKKVIEKMKSGALITHPNDSRRYTPSKQKGVTTGHAAPISNTQNSIPTTNNKTSIPSAKTASQLFSDEIRNKHKAKQIETNKKYANIFNRPKKSQSTGKGHWVTINGAHIFIED